MKTHKTALVGTARKIPADMAYYHLDDYGSKAGNLNGVKIGRDFGNMVTFWRNAETNGEVRVFDIYEEDIDDLISLLRKLKKQKPDKIDEYLDSFVAPIILPKFPTCVD